MAPLSDMTRKSGSSQVQWGEEQEQAFLDLKGALCKSPDFGEHFTVQTDASGVGLGAVLLQCEGDNKKPVAYISCKLICLMSGVGHYGFGGPSLVVCPNWA